MLPNYMSFSVHILMTQCVVGTSHDQSVCLQNFRQQTPIRHSFWPEISFFIGYFYVYQTLNRCDHRKVPNNENGNIWKNANHSHKKVKLLHSWFVRLSRPQRPVTLHVLLASPESKYHPATFFWCTVRPRIELGTIRSQVRCLDHYTTQAIIGPEMEIHY